LYSVLITGIVDGMKEKAFSNYIGGEGHADVCFISYSYKTMHMGSDVMIVVFKV